MTTQSEQQENNKNYNTSSLQLDSITTSIITTLLSGFLIIQNYPPTDVSGWFLAASIFGLVTLLIHYLSYIAAHYAQIYKLKDENTLFKFFSAVTHKINVTVYALVVIEFIISILVIIYK